MTNAVSVRSFLPQFRRTDTRHISLQPRWSFLLALHYIVRATTFSPSRLCCSGKRLNPGDTSVAPISNDWNTSTETTNDIASEQTRDVKFIARHQLFCCLSICSNSDLLVIIHGNKIASSGCYHHK
jgi:hypothetical protein